MASTARNHLTFTIVVHTSIIMLLMNLDFVECSKVNCLNFGHSCWGAHGKRSDIQDAPNLRVLAAKALLSEFPQNGIASSSKAQWLLSRLVAGQPILPLTDKYRVRWNNILKDKRYVPTKWERDATSTDNENLESIRVPIQSNAKGRKDNKDTVCCNTNEKPEDTAERTYLVVSSEEYEDPFNCFNCGFKLKY